VLPLSAQLASLQAKKREDWARVIVLCVYGVLSVLLLYGPIADVAAALVFSESLNLQVVLMMFVSGLPFNILHAVATVVFLAVLAHPMLEKLGRVKQKFGLLAR
jgi:energy-coupling factor transport system substrate-specific component